MIQSSMENESIQERQHSCKWYFDEATVVYNGIWEEDGKKSNPRLNEKIKYLDGVLKKQFVTKIPGRFTLSDYSNMYNELLQPNEEREKMSIFPLFVREIPGKSTDSSDDISISPEVFEKKKFEICKELNVIDSIVSRLCSDNADYSYRENGGNVVGADTVLKWLYTSSNPGKATKQEYDRATVVLRQIVNWYKKQKTDSERFAALTSSQRENVNALLSSVFVVSTSQPMTGLTQSGWSNDICKQAVLENVKTALGATLDDVENAYKKLNGFRRYAIRYEMATGGMRSEANMNKLLSLAHAILSFFLSVCVAYMRINNLQLPRAEFKGSRLIYSNISGSNFTNADFTHVDMSCAIAKNCDFSYATLQRAKADNADFSGSLFSYADLSGVDFSGATMNQVKMDEADIGFYSIDQLINFLNVKEDVTGHVFNTEWKDRSKILSYLTNLKSKASENAGAAAEKDFFKALPDTILESENADTDSQKNNYLEKTSMDRLCSVYKNGFAKVTKAELDVLSIDSDRYKDIVRNLDNPDSMRMLVVFHETSLKTSMLSNLNLSLIDMDLASFSDSDLSGCVLAYSKARGTDFSNANLTSSKAYNANFENASFSSALMFNMVFADCSMESVNFSKANLTNVTIINTDSELHNFIKRNVEPLHLMEKITIPQMQRSTKPDPKRQNDKSTNHNNVFFDVIANNILIAGCDLSRSTFEDAKFRSSILFDVDVTSTVWDGADLMYSIVCGVVFNRSSMKAISLQESKISATDFSCCNLSGSRLLGCVLDKSVFYDSNMNNVNLSHSEIRNTVFRDSSIFELNISYTQFINCIFIGIDFSSVIGLQNTTFTECIFIKCQDENGEIYESHDGLTKGKRQHLLQINDKDLICEDYKDYTSKFSDHPEKTSKKLS